MPLFCGLFDQFRDGTNGDKKSGRRSRTWSIFGNSNPESREVIKSLINTTVAPVRRNGPGKRPAMPQDFSTVSAYFKDPVEVADLSQEMRKVIDQLYCDLKGKEEKLSKEKFAAFVRNVQGEAAVPEDNRPFYDLGEFFYFWALLYSRALKSPKEKDLSKPLTNYFISSSHNTYLDGNQWTSKSSAEIYRTVLKRGCRCIEIDVLNGNTYIPTSTSKLNRADHQRGLSAVSGNSLPYIATAVFDTVDDMNGSVKNWGDKSASHSRSASTTSRPENFEDLSPRSSTLVPTETKETLDKLDTNGTKLNRPRSRSQIYSGEPIVAHNWTMTQPCGFREVCVAVKDSAFVNTDLPIIVSLEVHADAEQQEVMVRIMKEVWQDMLIDKPLDGFDPKFQLPKLQDLRGKILIKVKKAPNKLAQLNTSMSLPVPPLTPADSSEAEDEDGPPKLPQKTASDPCQLTRPEARPAPIAPAFPICEALGNLAVYTRSEKYRSPESLYFKKPPHIFSISESAILRLDETHHRDMFLHNKGYFMRAYPRGSRVDSSNPDPSPFWRKGVQMIAMNWQNLDEGMMLNEGMFADENGWVLKPPGYLGENKSYETQHEAAPGKTLDLTLTVYGGYGIPLGDEEKTRSGSDLRPFVKVELHVEKAEAQKDGQVQSSSLKQNTRTGKTDHPDFGPEGVDLRFRNISKVVPELSFLRIKVENESQLRGSSLLAWTCIRLDRLQQGYRLVNLMDTRGSPIKGGKLLIKFCAKYR